MQQPTAITVRTATAAYDVLVGRGLVRQVAVQMHVRGVRPAAAAVVCDSAVEPAARVVAQEFEAQGARACVLPVRASEAGKSLEALGDLCDRMLAAGIDRAGTVVAVGGGVVGDLAGFAAATYMRGIPCVQVPTTLLAMVDAAVGGKTAVNVVRADGSLAKNALGSFAQPRLVACDPDLLATLPARELRSGLAECVKHAVIADPAQLGWITERADPILAQDPDTLGELVVRNVRIKASIVGADEREDGVRAVLNLGHTFGHAIEALAHGQLTHGEAVAVGTVAACRLGASVAGCAGAVEDAVRATLARVGLPVRLPVALPLGALMDAMASDKKRRAGEARLVVPHALGDVRVHAGVPPERVREAWAAVGAA